MDMFATSDSDVDVERLMHEIRAAVNGKHHTTGPGSSARLTDAEHEPGSLILQPVFRPKQNNQYHINDLLRFHGEEFVRVAYRALLLREPDQSGMAHYSESLAGGRFSKIDVLASLHSSPEGRRNQVRLAGLWLPLTVGRLERIPLIGKVIRLMIAFVRLPRLLERHRQLEFYLTSQQQRIVDHQNRSHKELTDRLAQVLESVQAWMEHQQSLDARLRQSEETAATRLAEAREYIDRCTTKLNKQIALQDETLLQQQQELQQLKSQTDAQLQQLFLGQEQTLDKVATQHRELMTQARTLSVLLEEIKQNAPAVPKSYLSPIAADEEGHLLDGLYASFEDKFRGERDEIRERLQVYVPILKNAGITDGVLDVGCGRGEWLELLSKESIQARGVDHNRIVIVGCRHLGLDVVEEDALTYLRSLSAESMNAITSFHLVEHLQFEVLIRLLDEAFRILRRGGLLILETPNPENFIVGSYSFYADPTHRNPIPSETLKFLLESRGLESIAVMKLRPWDAAKIEGDSEIVKRFNEYFYCAPDYGTVARKP
jgi:O-antigen chain-terminating methyltransferase